MPSSTTVVSGAVYGTGIYGVDRYGVASVSVFINVDGVEASAILNDTLEIEADGLHAIVSVIENRILSILNLVQVFAGADVDVNGVEGTTEIGDVSQITVNRLVVDSTEAITEIGTIALETNNFIDADSVFATTQVGNVTVTGTSLVVLTGVSVSSFVNDNLTILENEVIELVALIAISAVGTPVVATTRFNFNAVANLYDRRRTVFIPRRTTSAERTVYVSALPRMVYVERRSNTNDRTLLAA